MTHTSLTEFDANLVSATVPGGLTEKDSAAPASGIQYALASLGGLGSARPISAVAELEAMFADECDEQPSDAIALAILRGLAA